MRRLRTSDRARSERGFTYLGLLLAIAVLGIGNDEVAALVFASADTGEFLIKSEHYEPVGCGVADFGWLGRQCLNYAHIMHIVNHI